MAAAVGVTYCEVLFRNVLLCCGDFCDLQIDGHACRIYSDIIIKHVTFPAVKNEYTLLTCLTSTTHLNIEKKDL